MLGPQASTSHLAGYVAGSSGSLLAISWTAATPVKLSWT